MKPVRYIRFCWCLLKFRLNRELIYSFNFWGTFLVDITVFLVQIATFSAIFLQAGSIGGWNKYQLIFFVGTFTIIDSLYMATYFFGLIYFPEKVRTGNLDLYLTKPVNTLFFAAFESMSPGSLFVGIPGVMMVIYSTAMLGIRVTVGRILGYVVLILLMCLLMFELMVILRTASFWFTRVDSIVEVEGELVSFSFRVPGVVFRGVEKVMAYVLVPYALIATIPTQFFTETLDGRHWFLVFGVVGFFWWLSLFLWRKGLRRYNSASS